MKHEILCPHCRYWGNAFIERKGSKYRLLCPRCGNVIQFGRKKAGGKQ